MLFVTGDTHADFTRFGTKGFPLQKTLTKADFVVVCGDFGIWDDSKSEHYWLDWLDNKPFTTLFVTGNHSNYDLLRRFPVERWRGGDVQRIRGSVLHLMRGQVFDIDGKRFFTMGGASSHDIQDGVLEPDAPDFSARRRALDRRGGMYRVNHLSWWKEELPNAQEYEAARASLDACGWRVDGVITHCCPTSVMEVAGGGRYRRDALTDFFEEVAERCSFDYWFFGHYHDNRVIGQKYILLYKNIVKLGDDGVSPLPTATE